jgi:hypothetical protein
LIRVISRVGGEIGALYWRELDEEFADCRPKALDSSFGGFSQQRLELGEGVLDGIEVGTVGRKVWQPRAGRFDGGANAGPLVTGEIVHDDDVAGRQRGNQNLIDISLKPSTVDGAVEHHGRGRPAAAQPADEFSNVQEGWRREAARPGARGRAIAPYRSSPTFRR